ENTAARIRMKISFLPAKGHHGSCSSQLLQRVKSSNRSAKTVQGFMIAQYSESECEKALDVRFPSDEAHFYLSANFPHYSPFRRILPHFAHGIGFPFRRERLNWIFHWCRIRD